MPDQPASTDLPNPTELVVRMSGAPDAEARLVVLMHGFGADENDMLSLAPHLGPGIIVAAPRAPVELEWGGRAWYPLQVTPTGVADDPAYGRGAAAAAESVLAWLAGQADGWRAVTIGGFSQGASVALAAMAQRPDVADGWLVLSGFAAPTGAEPAPTEPLPRVFWSRDTADPIVPERWTQTTETWLADRAQVSAHRYPGLGHSLDARVIDDLVAFLR